jgi:chromosome segregation ATPase
VSTAELTGLLSGLGAFVTAIIALYATYRSVKKSAADARRAEAEGGLASWDGLNRRLQEERDRLLVRLADAEDECRTRVRELEAEHDKQLSSARARIAHLEQETAALYRRLYKEGN